MNHPQKLLLLGVSSIFAFLLLINMVWQPYRPTAMPVPVVPAQSQNQLDQPPPITQADTTTKAHVVQAFGQLPLSFEANRGQTDPQVKFLSRGPGYTLFLTPNEAVLSLQAPTKREPYELPRIQERHFFTQEKRTPAAPPSVLRMKILNANPSPKMTGIEQLSGYSNYLLGNDPKKWRSRIAQYNRVKYAAVYPGIDLVYYGNQRQLEYDFIVAPGADPNEIRLKFEGAKQVQITKTGELAIETENGEVRQHKPKIYQEAEGGRREVAGNYVVLKEGQVGFSIEQYDTEKELIIDPILTYATYIGGSHSEIGYSIAVDENDNAFVTGATGSSNFPTTNAIQSTFQGPGDVFDGDAFVIKLNTITGKVSFSTYLGGDGFEEVNDIVIDSEGNAYIAGRTGSSNYPTVNPLQPLRRGTSDAFVTKLNSNGTALIYSSYLGGSLVEQQVRIAIDAINNIYVAGTTSSNDFPSAVPIQSTIVDLNTIFVAKLNTSGSTLLYSLYLGGGSGDFVQGINIDSAGNAYLTGNTDSTNFPVQNPIQGIYGGGIRDAFVTKINSTGTALIYSTYLGGDKSDYGFQVVLDTLGNVYVAGWTDSTNFPTVNAIQPMLGGDSDAYVTKIDPNGSKYIYSTYIGGSGLDLVNDIVADAKGNTYITGLTRSPNYPTVNAIQLSLQGPSDAFITTINSAGTDLIYSTFLGGSGTEFGYGIAVDLRGNAYITGNTTSTDFPTVSPVQSANGGDRDVFIVKISDQLPACPTNAPPLNLLINGGFEQSTFGLGLLTTPGWTITQGTIDIHPDLQAAEGTKTLELIGTPGVAAIEQTFTTIPGRIYTLTGWMSHHVGVPFAGADILVNGVPLERLFHSEQLYGKTSNTNMRWQRFERCFTARATQTKLRLIDQNLAGYIFGGMVIDGLSVQDSCSNEIALEVVGQPTNQTVCFGGTTTFSVITNQPCSATYQWRKDGVVIAGATSSNYAVRLARATDIGNYDVVISNGFGSVISNVASLTVLQAVTSQPANQATVEGGSATFAAAVTGTPSIQWQVSTNGGTTWNNIPGATNLSLPLSPVTAAMNGNRYRVVFNNPTCATVISNAAQLTVSQSGHAVITTNTLIYPATVVTRAPNTVGPSQPFVISNNGGAPLTLTFASLLRTNAPTQMSEFDELSFFSLFMQNANGTESRLNFGETVTLLPAQAQSFRLAFTPTYPPLALRVRNLPASLVLPETLTARLIFSQNTGQVVAPPPLVLNLNASVRGNAKLIHPTDATLPPLVTLRIVDDSFEAECFVHDPNLNLNLVRFEFLDSADRRVVPPTDVTITPANIAAAGLVQGQSISLLQRFPPASRYPTVVKVRVTIYDGEGTDTVTSGGVLPVAATTATVSAASYQADGLTSESIASAFGQRLAVTTQSATTLPLPTALHGTQVRVKDSTGTERIAPLFFVSPQQVNFLIPAGTATGMATITIYNGEGAISVGNAQINTMGPGLFTANANGKGVVAGTVLRVAPNGSRSHDSTSQLTGTGFVAKPIELGNDQVFLELYGTGWRNNTTLNNVTVTVGGVPVPVLYAGKQSDYMGVDQVNIQLPNSLAGKGEMELRLRVNGKAANTVSLHVK